MWDSKENRKKLFTEENVILKDFFAKNFSLKITSQNSDKYKLTIAIAEKHYFENVIFSNDKNDEYIKGFQALLYPTIAMKASSDNFAIKPSFILDGGLDLVSVEFLEATEGGTEIINFDGIEYRIETLAESDSFLDDGTIVWQDSIKHWAKGVNFEDLTYTFEEDKWVARDADGNIIEPDN